MYHGLYDFSRLLAHFKYPIFSKSVMQTVAIAFVVKILLQLYNAWWNAVFASFEMSSISLAFLRPTLEINGFCFRLFAFRIIIKPFSQIIIILYMHKKFVQKSNKVFNVLWRHFHPSEVALKLFNAVCIMCVYTRWKSKKNKWKKKRYEVFESMARGKEK